MKKLRRRVNNKLKGALGVADFDKGEVQINKIKAKRAGQGEVLKTILHEEKHFKSPTMKEKNVEQWAQRQASKLPKRMKQAYYDGYRKRA